MKETEKSQIILPIKIEYNIISKMTKEQFIFLIETQKPFEFTYNNVVYNMTYDKNEKGEKVIVFGRLYEGIDELETLLYEGKKYKSAGELLNTARIENHFFKDMLDIL